MTTVTASAKCTFKGIGDDFKFEGQPWSSGALELNVEAITSAITRLAAGLRAEVEARLDLEARVENIGCRVEEVGSATHEPASLIPFWTEDNKLGNTSTSKADAYGGVAAPDLRGLELSWMQLQKSTEHLKQDLVYHKRQQDQKARAADEMMKLRFESLTRDIDSRVRIADLASHGDALLVQAKSVIECEGRVAAKAAISEDMAQLHSGLECVSSALEERQRLLEERFDNLPVSCPSTSPGTPSSAASTGLPGTDDVYLDAAPEKGSKGSRRNSLVGDELAQPMDGLSVGWVQDQLTELRTELALVAEQGRQAITLVEGAGGSNRGCAPNSTTATNHEINQHDELQGRALRQDIADVEDQLRKFRDEVHAKLEQLVQPKIGSDANDPTKDQTVCRTGEESGGCGVDSADNNITSLGCKVEHDAGTGDATIIDSSTDAGLGATASLSHGIAHQPPTTSEQFAAWVEAQFATLRNEMAALADLSMQQPVEKDAVTMDMVRQALRSQVGEPLGRVAARVSDLESARPLSGAPAAALHEDMRKLTDRLNLIELNEAHHPEHHADAFLKFQGSGGRNGEDGSREMANITHAVRGVQKDAERVSSKVDDLGAGLAALRGHVEAALPQLLSAMMEVAAQHGKATNVDDEAGSGDLLQAAHDACSREYTRTPVFASREAHETLQKIQRAMEDEFRKQLTQLKEEMARQSNVGHDRLFHVNTRLQAAEKSLPLLEQQLWQMAQSKESFVENPALTRVPLLEARCICCDQKAALMEAKQGPWSQGGMPNTLWAQREPSCPAHHAAGPPRGYRQRRDHSLPAIDRAMSR